MLVLRLGSSALVSVVDVRSLVVVVVLVCVSLAQLAKLRARIAITPLAIIFMLSVYSIDNATGKLRRLLAAGVLFRNRVRSAFVLPIDIHDPPAFAVVE